jgi:hypothetical protein
MILLDFPPFSFRIRNSNRGEEIFDLIRKKFILLTEEEWVRQHCIMHLINDKGYPASLISVEKALKVNNLTKRTDIVIFGRDLKPKMIVECKAPQIIISNDVFNQIARYNMSLNVDYLLVTNGLQHYSCYINHNKNSFSFLEKIPEYQEIIQYQV